MKNIDRKFFKIADVFIILFAVLASVVALLSQFHTSSDSYECEVRVGGEPVYSINLSEITKPIEYTVDGDIPVTVVIERDGVYVKSAQCPDKLCEHTGKITRASQAIICLPAKVSVTLISESSSYDAIVG